MILTGADGRKYMVHFQYQPLEGADRFLRMKDNMIEVSHVTTARIHLDRCDQTKPCTVQTDWIGKSYCSVLDQFVHRKGRKTALQRALVKAAERGERAMLWASYHKQTNELDGGFRTVLRTIRGRKDHWTDEQKAALLEALLGVEDH